MVEVGSYLEQTGTHLFSEPDVIFEFQNIRLLISFSTAVITFAADRSKKHGDDGEELADGDAASAAGVAPAGESQFFIFLLVSR